MCDGFKITCPVLNCVCWVVCVYRQCLINLGVLVNLSKLLKTLSSMRIVSYRFNVLKNIHGPPTYVRLSVGCPSLL